MRFFYLVCALGFCSTPFIGQAVSPDVPRLDDIRAKYDAPFKRNLESFSCDVEFDWKAHFSEVVRLGDEGTDEEIAKFIQPIRTRVTVTEQKVLVSTGMTEDEEHKLPHGGMAQGLLEHAVQFSLNNWLAASGTALLTLPTTTARVEAYASGFRLDFRIQTFDVELLFARDLRLQSERVKGSPSDTRETDFSPGPHGFILTSFRQGEDGDFRPGNRIIDTYTYQTVGEVQLPDQLAINRESHREQWHFKLTHCTVSTIK